MAKETGRKETSAFAAKLRVIAAVGALLLGWTGGIMAETLRDAPNTHISMEVPEALEPIEADGTGLFGFMDKFAGAAFYIEEKPAAAFEGLKALSERPNGLREKDIVDFDTKKLELPGRKGDYIYLSGLRETPVGNINHYVLIMREKGITAIINANIPQLAIEAQSITMEQIERAMISATVR